MVTYPFKEASATVDIAGVPHKIHYYDWPYIGAPGKCKGELICLHGLSRNARDFDFLAYVMSKHYRVICPDFIGRGKSQWLVVDRAHYSYPFYCEIMHDFIKALGLQKVILLGTSMGGFTSMLIAAKYPSIVRALVLNDVSAWVDKDVIRRSAFYLKPRNFLDEGSVVTFMRKFLSPLGLEQEEHWDHMIWNSVFKGPEGDGYTLNYDPMIWNTYHEIMENLPETGLDFSKSWESLSCPVYLIRGKQSKYLTTESLTKMLNSGKIIDYVEYDKAGHAPGLANAHEIAKIESWLK